MFKHYRALSIAVLSSCAVSGCDISLPSSANDKRVQSENELRIAIERFSGESLSASEGSLQSLSIHLSNMRRLKSDTEAIVAFKSCKTFQQKAKERMTDVVDAWASVKGVPMPSAGDFGFDVMMAIWREETAERAQLALDETETLRQLGGDGCSSLTVEQDKTNLNSLPALERPVVDEEWSLCDAGSLYVAVFINRATLTQADCLSNPQSNAACTIAERQAETVRRSRECLLNRISEFEAVKEADPEQWSYELGLEDAKNNLIAFDEVYSLRSREPKDYP